MMTFTIILLVLLICTISGMFLNLMFWACFRLPLAIAIASLGLILCMTIILIPAGIACFKASANLAFSFV